MRAGRILLALLFGVGLFGVLVNGAALYSRFLYISVLLGTISWVWTRMSASGLNLQRSSRVLRANVGEVFEERFELSNANHLPAVWIEVINQSTLPFAAGSRLFTFVLGRHRRSYLRAPGSLTVAVSTVLHEFQR